MKVEECIAKLEKYFASSDMRPRFVNIENRHDLKEILDHFKMASYAIKTPSDYSVPDHDPSVEKLTAGLLLSHQPIILTGFSTQMKLKGTTALATFLNSLAHITSGKVAILCYQCDAQLCFDDPRLKPLVYNIEADPDSKPRLVLLGRDVNPGNKYSVGIDKAGCLLESLSTDEVRISTQKCAADYPDSLYSISEIKDAYDALCMEDSSTLLLQRDWGTKEQWSFALQGIHDHHTWSQWFTSAFGASPMSIIAGSWNGIGESNKWLFFIGLKLNGAPECRCLDKAAKDAQTYLELPDCIYTSIIDISWQDPGFRQDYEQRKSLLRSMGCSETAAKNYLNQVKQHEKDAIRYMTDNTKVEKEAIINTISMD